MNRETNISKGDRPLKKVFTFRIDPQLKEAAKKAAREVKLTVSRYIQELIRRDLWSKGLLR
ncbi:MAG: hypothetical protein ACOYOI_09430 [Chthoniobacterales bacterium]|jgi:predicted HicB family RNase H-like nuclease